MKKKYKILVVLCLISILVALMSCKTDSDPENKASTPVITVTVAENVTSVTIATETEDAEIYYTIDDGEEVKYEKVITLEAGLTEKTYRITAVAKKDGYLDSEAAVKDVVVAAKSVTVTFKDGDEVIASKKVVYGSAVEAPAAPEKAGYTFEGWYNGETAYDKAAVYTEDTVYTAKWSLDTGTSAITVTYSASDITVTASKPDADGKITLTASSDYSNYKWVYNDETVGTKNVLEITQTTAGTYIYELTAEKNNETYSACVYVVIK